MDKAELLDLIKIKDTYAHTLGIEIIEAADDYAKVTMPFDGRHRNAAGLIHGGAMYAAADLAFAAAANAAGETTLSVTSTLSFLSSSKTGPVTGEAKLISKTRRIIVYDVKVTDGEGELIAAGQITGYRKKSPA